MLTSKAIYLILFLISTPHTHRKYLSLSRQITIPLITWISPCHSTISTSDTIIVHHQIYQKPHHKYMYPHFSSNHPHHIFSGIIKTETIRYSRLSATIDNFNFIHHHFTLSLGSFSIDDGDGTKNVTFKMNLCFFKLCRIYSNSLKMSNVGKFPWS